MKIRRSSTNERALTLMEVMMIIAVLLVLVALFVSNYDSKGKERARRISCVGRLKQVGLAFRVWQGDHNDRYPMSVSTNEGGTMEFVEGPNAYRHLEVMSNELSTPIILLCPAEYDRTKKQATYFRGGFPRPAVPAIPFAGNSNLSYFVGVDAVDTSPQMFLSGDHNLTHGTPIVNGLLTVLSNSPANWTGQMHKNQGNVGLADGSVQSFSSRGVWEALKCTGFITNRLQMP